MRSSSNEVVRVTFRNENDDGILADMDNLPTAQLYVDGALDSSVGVIVTRLGVGTYRATWTMGSYNVNDIWELVVTGVYNGISYTRIVKEGYIGEPAFVGTTRYTRLQVFINETSDITWLVGEYDLDEMSLQMKVGTGSYDVRPILTAVLHIFNDGDITRSENQATVSIPAIISGSVGVYPWILYDVTTGQTEIQSGTIDVVQQNN